MRVQTMEQSETVIYHDTAFIIFIVLWIAVDTCHRKLYMFLLKIKIFPLSVSSGRLLQHPGAG